jgi:MFS family permease
MISAAVRAYRSVSPSTPATSIAPSRPAMTDGLGGDRRAPGTFNGRETRASERVGIVAAVPGPIPTDGGALTRMQWRVWALSAMGVMLDGFDLFIMGVALPLVARDFGLSSVQQGLVGAAAVIGAIVGALLLGRLADVFGRRALFRIDLVLFIVFAIASALAWDVWSLVVFRLLLGVAIGADYPISAAYVAEFMPARLRGRMLVSAFAFQAAGSLLGALVGISILVVDPSEDAWRWMLAAGVVPAAIVMALRLGVPESPSWAEERRSGRTAGMAAPGYRRLLATGVRARTALATIPWSLMDVCLYGVGIFTP